MQVPTRSLRRDQTTESFSHLTRATLCLATVTVSIFVSQACEGFRPAELNVSSLGNGFHINSGTSSPAVDQTLTYIAAGLSFSSDAQYTWSQSFNDITTGATLAPCDEPVGASHQSFELVCHEAGVLTVQLNVTDASTVYDPATIVQSVVAAPAPPPPVGQNAAGVPG